MKAEVGGGVEEAGAVWARGSHGKEPEIGLKTNRYFWRNRKKVTSNVLQCNHDFSRPRDGVF